MSRRRCHHLQEIFANTLFIDPKDRETVALDIQSFYKEIGCLLNEMQVDVSLYLSGSLARQEPSICRDAAGQPQLFSDFDFILSASADALADPRVIGFESVLKTKYPQFNSSVFLVESQTLHAIKAGVGRDLGLSYLNPVYTTHPSHDLNPHLITDEERFDLIVYQLASYYLHPQRTDHEQGGLFFRSDYQYHYLKLILESLRSQFPASEKVNTYKDMFEKRYESRLYTIMSPEKIESFIRARELYGRYPIPALQMAPFIRSAVSPFLGAKETLSTEEFYRALQNKAHGDNSLVTRFGCAMIAFALCTETEVKMDNQHTLSLIRLIEGVDLSPRADQTLQSWSSGSLLPSDPRCVHVMLELRSLFIPALYERNMGRKMNSPFIEQAGERA